MASRLAPPAGVTRGAVAVLISFLAVALGSLQLLVSSRAVDSTFIPSPVEVAESVPAVLLGSAFPIAQTLGMIVLAFGIAMAIGLPLGLAMGGAPRFRSVANSYVSLLLSTPKIIFLPVVILWLGLGLTATLSFAALEASLPVVVLVTGAVRDLDPDMLRVGKALGATGAQMQTKVVLPAVLPSVYSAGRLCFLFSAVGVLVAQMFIGFGGIGAILINDAYELRIPHLYAMAVVLSAGIVIFLVLSSVVFHAIFGRRVARSAQRG